ncbi:MAG: hypothetical protein KAH56_13910 [Candidatus Krumholzibacteria bacterium]|nr:hypothetical protein [Candidatus Krumholzibacteria bacterium]
MFESVRFNLQHIRIDLFFPKPLRAAELDVFRINQRDFLQGLEEPFSLVVVFKTESNIGNPVLDPGNDLCGGQGINIIGVSPATVQEMSVATLKGETEGWPVEILDDFNYWCVNFRIRKNRHTVLFLLSVIRVFRQFFWFREGLQLSRPFSRDDWGDPTVEPPMP